MEDKKTKKFINIFKQVLKLDNVKLKNLLKGKIDIKLNEYQNWDSMSHVKILTLIEKNFKIKINSSNVNKFNAFKSGINYLKKK